LDPEATGSGRQRRGYTYPKDSPLSQSALDQRVYAHLGIVRHRSEVVEYRLEQHLEALKDRLGQVGFVTRNVTAEQGRGENDPPLQPKSKRGNSFRSGPGATRTRDLLLRSRPTPATASARQRKSLKNQRPVASGR
jgi:hypothetical protein